MGDDKGSVSCCPWCGAKGDATKTTREGEKVLLRCLECKREFEITRKKRGNLP